MTKNLLLGDGTSVNKIPPITEQNEFGQDEWPSPLYLRPAPVQMSIKNNLITWLLVCHRNSEPMTA